MSKSVSRSDTSSKRDYMTRAKLRGKDWEAELVASDDELAKAIGTVVSQMPKIPEKRRRQSRTPRSRTLRDLVDELLRRGVFENPRSAPEVERFVGDFGNVYAPGSVAHVLADMVREGVLLRSGVPKRFQYQARHRIVNDRTAA